MKEKDSLEELQEILSKAGLIEETTESKVNQAVDDLVVSEAREEDTWDRISDAGASKK